MANEEKVCDRINRRFIPTIFVFVTILLIMVICTNEANAEEPVGKKCLIIVSGYGGYPSTELVKASSFHDYINCTDEDIVYLTSPSDPDTDGPANISNVEDAFEWLQNNSLPSDEVTIYISDHEKRVMNDTYFVFDDGNISSDTIDSWLDQVQCSGMTLILNGERSGLGGPDLSKPTRVVICSMGSEEENDPDLFNITRGLNDPQADTDGDGEVSFEEAFWSEYYTVIDHGQTPCIWG